jgi:hypothetical protein
VRVVNGGRFPSRGGDRLPEDAVGIVDDEQPSTGRATRCAGLSRFMVADVPATQNAASPTASCATMSSPSPTL